MTPLRENQPEGNQPRESAKYSQTPPYGQPLNADTSLLRPFFFVPGERKPLDFLLIRPA